MCTTAWITSAGTTDMIGDRSLPAAIRIAYFALEKFRGTI